MNSLLETIAHCLTGGGEPEIDASPEKQGILVRPEYRSSEAVAKDVIQAIIGAEKGGKDLQRTLDRIVGEYGWTEKVAEWTLAKLEAALKETSKLKPPLKEACNRAWEAAREIEGFVQEHPVFCTVIALGVLALMAPWAIEALGFGELGPIEGSFASWWQARYAGTVPKGSLFSFFQRLGMTWR
ncbi:hypothetical protein BS50DRAFT_572248 [Corynespora cassiicola Philippines]|uniref:Uncharacterized protein n=1 Tax=Corynespora cassiicola Philippines TaxID=1448308 RepID=A0A2T2NUJ7_CORCC|nr:hypothetical protein BS50DRAFT_572248 [Corynespora cassiicola Philippines]